MAFGGEGEQDDRQDGGGWSLNGAPPQDERLAFPDEERLPWLESIDDEDEDAGVDSTRLIGFALSGLVVLVAVLGGIWWLSHRSDTAGPQPDGSTIAAPATPYKQRPSDPGGKTFDGTGDSSYVVSEGKTLPPRLGTPAGGPVVAPTPSPSPTASPSAAASAAPAPQVAGVGVQVGAYSSRESAEAGWTRLSGQYEALSGVKHRVVEGRADIGTVYRLQAVPGDATAANALCGNLKAAGLACQVKK